MESSKIKIIFMEKNKKELTIEVELNSQISETLQSLNEYFQVPQTNGVKLYKRENKVLQLDENSTFLQENVRDGDTLYGHVEGNLECSFFTLISFRI